MERETTASSALLPRLGILLLSYELSHAETEAWVTAAVAISNAAFTTVLALVFLDERLDSKQWVGVATVILGTIILRI